MDEGLTLDLPSNLDSFFDHQKNITIALSEAFDGDVSAQPDPDYEQFLADVWVGIVLTLMVLSCVCCMCSCLLYHKFQQWKRHVIGARNAATVEMGNGVESDLPSYTIASGLPTYQEALEQLKKVKELTKPSSANGSKEVSEWVPRTPPTPMPLSVTTLFQHVYRNPEGAKGS